MGTNKFLNGEGDVDLSELINEINALSNEVEGKLDKDGSDGGMTGNLAINDNAIFLGAVGSLDSVGGSTTLFQSDAGGDLALISNRDVIIGATNEIRMNDNLNMNSNDISGITNLFANGIDVNFLTITSQLAAQTLVAPTLNNLRIVSDDIQLTPDNIPGNQFITLSVGGGIEANTNLDMGGNEINNCSNVPIKKAVGLVYQTAYTYNVYSDMVNAWSGSPDVPAGSLDIGDTIELTTQFNLDATLIGASPSIAGNFRISFAGVVLGVLNNLILTGAQTRVGELKLSITRVDTALIQVNVVGYYNNSSFTRVSILPTPGPLSYPYNENVSNTIQIEWRPSIGNVAEYMTCNLQNTKIIQY